MSDLEALRAELTRLGKTWSRDHTEDQLKALVDAVELGIDLEAKYAEVPVCIGLAWDPIPDDSICRECAAVDDCKLVFSRTLARRREAGGDISDWCRDLGVTPEAIRQASGSLTPEVPAAKPEARPDPVLIPDAVVVQDVPAKKRRGKGKAPPKPKKSRAPDRPTMARSALTAAEPGVVSSSPASDTPVVAVEARDAAYQGHRKRRKMGPKVPWDKKTWPARYRRERERSPWIAALRPGMSLERVYKGKTWGILVLNPRYYKLLPGEEEFPTLQAVVERIVGVGKNPRQLCPWSAARFFGMRTLLGRDARL